MVLLLENTNRPPCKQGGLIEKVFWRGPTLPGAHAPSTIGAGGLNGRVRYGNGCFPSAIPTRNLEVKVRGWKFNHL